MAPNPDSEPKPNPEPNPIQCPQYFSAFYTFDICICILPEAEKNKNCEMLLTRVPYSVTLYLHTVSLLNDYSLASFRRQLKMELFTRSFPDLDSSAHDRIWQILCSHFASYSRFVTVFSVCKVSLQSFDITPPKSLLSMLFYTLY